MSKASNSTHDETYIYMYACTCIFVNMNVHIFTVILRAVARDMLHVTRMIRGFVRVLFSTSNLSGFSFNLSLLSFPLLSSQLHLLSSLSFFFSYIFFSSLYFCVACSLLCCVALCCAMLLHVVVLCVCVSVCVVVSCVWSLNSFISYSECLEESGTCCSRCIFI